MINKLRYAWASLTKSSAYLNAFNDCFLDYYMRHHKIIGWWKGLPVYSAFLTPGLSKPLGNTLARRLLSNLLQKPLPGMVNVAVTDICNAKCEHCSFFSALDKPGEKVMTTSQLKGALRACQDYGISVINFVGGEPLLRKDLPQIIASLDKNKSTSCLYTNGWFLAQKAKSLKQAGLMMVIVSLDSSNAQKHDAFRKSPGMFDRAIKGIKAAQKIGLLTAISTTLTQDDLTSGTFEKMIHLAKRLNVNELIVFDTMPIGMYSHREDLKAQTIDKQKLFELIDQYNAKKGFPGIFCYAHFRDNSAFGCSAGRNYFYVSPYGEMHPCDFTAKAMGNILTEPIADVWDRLSQARSCASDGFLNECCKTQTHMKQIKK